MTEFQSSLVNIYSRTNNDALRMSDRYNEQTKRKMYTMVKYSDYNPEYKSDRTESTIY